MKGNEEWKEQRMSGEERRGEERRGEEEGGEKGERRC